MAAALLIMVLIPFCAVSLGLSVTGGDYDLRCYEQGDGIFSQGEE